MLSIFLGLEDRILVLITLVPGHLLLFTKLHIFYLQTSNQAPGLEYFLNFKVDLNLRFSLKNDKSVLQSFF